MRLIRKLRKAWDQRFKEQSFSLDELDWKLKPYLDFANGFFVEAGANDGVTYTNTLYFERYRNWSGLLIEPIPKLAELCKANRPRCIVENCALVSSDCAEKEVSMYYCGLMSLIKGAMKSAEADLEHVRKGCGVQDLQSYEVKVPARTLTSVLDQHGIGKIDFLSLDVEGYELNALRGLDFERYRPRFMLIEARFREEIDAFLQPNYERMATLSHHDVLYCERGVGSRLS